LITQTFTMNNDGFVYVTGDDVRNFNGRADLVLVVDGSTVHKTITFTSSLQWEGGHVAWSGPLTAGSHTVTISSPIPDVWGCRDLFGAINTIILE